jgi:hypothetical protein
MPAGSVLDYHDAHVRYARRRAAAYDHTIERFRPLWPRLGLAAGLDALRLTGIDGHAVNAWRFTWPESPYADANFPWDRIARHAWRYPRRFDLAIWYADALCGLCLGKPSEGPDNLTIRLLEGKYGPHPLKGAVALIATVTAERYAAVLGKRLLKIKNASPGAISRYEALGFSLAEPFRGAKYHARSVDEHAELPLFPT